MSYLDFERKLQEASDNISIEIDEKIRIHDQNITQKRVEEQSQLMIMTMNKFTNRLKHLESSFIKDFNLIDEKLVNLIDQNKTRVINLAQKFDDLDTNYRSVLK